MSTKDSRPGKDYPDNNADKNQQKLIGIVGPCSAGKSTLINRLSKLGIETRHIAQEHSFVPDMWKRMVAPDKLIFLDVSYPVSMKRRHLDITEEEFNLINERLSHARENADLYINTDELSSEEVFQQVLKFLSETD